MNLPLSLPVSLRSNATQQEAVLDILRQCSDQGWLRHLDTAFASFLADLAPEAPAAILIAAAMLSQMEGRGHSCLPLASLLRSPMHLLGWPPEAEANALALWTHMPHDLATWQGLLAANTLVQAGNSSLDQGQPLVMDGPNQAPRLYLRRYWNYERTVAQAIAERTASALPVDQEQVRYWLDRLFPSSAAATATTAVATPSSTPAAAQPDWQKMACAIALRGRLAIITGGPGTGKTYTAARLLALLLATHPEPASLRIALAAPTGKAAARLRQSIDNSLSELQRNLGQELDLATLMQRIGAARTLHSLLGARPDTRRLRHHAGNPLDIDVVMVDEASMVHLEMMAALLQALPAHSRLILLGDKDQLASVEAGAVLGDLCRDAQAGCYSPQTADYLTATTGTILPGHFLARTEPAPALAQHIVMLRASHRFQGPIGQLAQAVNQGDEPKLPLQLLQNDSSHALFGKEDAPRRLVDSMAVDGRPGTEASYRHYLERLAQGPAGTDELSHSEWASAILRDFDRCRVLCAVREGDWGVEGVNRSIALALAKRGWLKPYSSWYPGRPVIVTRNDPGLGVFNGDIGIALPPPGAGPLRVYFLDGNALRSVAVSRLAHIETAFAMTVHKSQGSEFEHTILVLAAHSGNVLTRELVYTGITRARRAFSLIAERAGLLEAGVAQVTQRESGLWVKESH